MKRWRGRRRNAIGFFLMVAGWAFVVAAQSGKATPSRKPATRTKPPTYVGSEVCRECHSDIAESYLKTDMGRSVSQAKPASPNGVPTVASVFDPRANRHFEVFSRGDTLFQSEYETAADGREVFRDTRKIDWLLGAGANGIAGIVRRGAYLFEAPLSYYTNIRPGKRAE